MSFDYQAKIRRQRELWVLGRCSKDPATGCWNWTGSYFSGTGYPRLGNHPAYRVVWEMVKGPIPEGFEVDHMCRNPACINPSHLEPVSKKEHRRRHRLSRLEHASLMNR